jgi:hypothetical protein
MREPEVRTTVVGRGNRPKRRTQTRQHQAARGFTPKCQQPKKRTSPVRTGHALRYTRKIPHFSTIEQSSVVAASSKETRSVTAPEPQAPHMSPKSNWLLASSSWQPNPISCIRRLVPPDRVVTRFWFSGLAAGGNRGRRLNAWPSGSPQAGTVSTTHMWKA